MGFSNQVTVRKAKIGPVACYFEGQRFLGQQYGLFLGICLVGLLIGGAVPVVLYGPMSCGIALCYILRARGERTDLENLFKGFEFFVPGLVATLIYICMNFVMLIPLLVMTLVSVVGMNSQELVVILSSGILLFLAFAGWFVVAGITSLLFMLAAFLIVDKNLDGHVAMRLAVSGLMANFFGILSSSIVGQLAILLGTAMCIVPGFLVFPIVLAGHFVVYQKIFGVETLEPVMATEVDRKM